jgi:hypothetical protein
MNTNTTTPDGVVSSAQLGKWADRTAFERWYTSTDARYWNTSDAAYGAWCAALEAERERIRSLLRAEQVHAADTLGPKTCRAAHDACGSVLEKL